MRLKISFGYEGSIGAEGQEVRIVSRKKARTF
jgi:hypothetical protein